MFWNMSVPDQRHALNVSYNALSLAKGRPLIDGSILVKAALLHDVGKIRGDISTIDKIITVLASRLAPQWAEKWGIFGRGNKLDNVKHAFYIYYHHAERSCEMVTAINTNAKIAAIIAWHHTSPVDGDPPELNLLRQADNLN